MLKKPWADGTTAFVMEPLDFITRLVATIPPPRFHTLRFHGVLAPHSTLRPLVVPKPPAAARAAPLQLSLFELPKTNIAVPRSAVPTEPPYKGRHCWALLLRHVFAADVTRCVQCKGRMRLRQFCTTPQAIARAMTHAGLGPQPPPPASQPLTVHPVHPSQRLLPFG